MKKSISSLFLLPTLLFFICSTLFAAPMEQAPYKFAQPDGTLVPVLVTGDEFFSEVHSPDGALLIRDSSGWICYAEVNAEGSDYISTGVRYGVPDEKGVMAPPPPPQHSTRKTLSPAEREKRAQKRLRAMFPNGRELPDMKKRFPAPAASGGGDGSSAASDTIKGITVLFDFSDEPASVSKEEIENLMNQEGYKGGGNNGSVRDYYYEVSNGQITYLNIVSDYVRASITKASIDNDSVSFLVPEDRERVKALLREVLEKAVQAGSVDVSQLTVDDQGLVRGVNFFYAGSPSAGWYYGLWPHQGNFEQPIDIGGGKKVKRYQMSNTGTIPSIGMVVHENGHLLFGWPDLYHYSGVTKGAGYYCLMSYAFRTTPIYPNPYFRLLQGWIDTVDFSGHAKGELYTLHDTSKTIYAYSGKTKGSANEMFLFEVKTRSGRNIRLPDAGLAIWHIDTEGDNMESNPTEINGPFDLVNIEQADGYFDLEYNRNMGDVNDLFDSSTPIFNDQTSPSAVWHNQTNSQIDIRVISAAGKTMSFSYGEWTPFLTVVNGTGSGRYTVGTSVTIRANAAEIGKAFSKWEGSEEDLALLGDQNAEETSLTMPNRDVTLTADYRDLSPDGILMTKAAGVRARWNAGVLQLHLAQTRRVEASLHSPDGKSLWRTSLGVLKSGDHRIPLPITPLSKGHYWLKLSIDRGETVVLEVSQ